MMMMMITDIHFSANVLLLYFASKRIVKIGPYLIIFIKLKVTKFGGVFLFYRQPFYPVLTQTAQMCKILSIRLPLRFKKKLFQAVLSKKLEMPVLTKFSRRYTC